LWRAGNVHAESSWPREPEQPITTNRPISRCPLVVQYPMHLKPVASYAYRLFCAYDYVKMTRDQDDFYVHREQFVSMSACRTGTDLCDEPRTIDGRFEMVPGRVCSHRAPFFRQVCAQGPACTSAAAACEHRVFTFHKPVSCCNMHTTRNRRHYRHS